MTKFRSIFLAVTIFILNSCTFLSYNELPSLLSSAIFGSKEIEVDKKFYDNADYSFINIRLNNKSSAILTLFDIENNSLKWISSDGEILITQNGKVYQSIGLPNDFETLNIDFKIKDKSVTRQYIKLTNPNGFFAQDNVITYVGKENISYLDNLIGVDVYKETSYIEELNRKTSNIYYVMDGKVLKAIQNIQPGIGTLELEYYFK